VIEVVVALVAWLALGVWAIVHLRRRRADWRRFEREFWRYVEDRAPRPGRGRSSG
jgi:hypothetical protein